MDRKLYVERWLLAVKDACTQEGLPAHVRALDHKGGQRLTLVIRQGDEAVEFCYRKRLAGVRMLAAATSPAFAARVKEVYARLLREHRRLLQNGYRRFLKRSIRLLGEIESAPPGSLASEVPEAKGASPGLLARRLRGLPARYEVLPAAAFLTPTSARFVGVVEKKLIELIDLIPGEDGPSAPQANVTPAASSAGGVELVSALALPAAGAAAVAAGAAAAGLPPVADEAQAAAAAAVPSVVPPPAGGVGDGVAAIAEGLANVVDGAEVVAAAGSCLSDAACSAPDCSGVDLSGLDCGGIDCGGF